MSSELRLVTIEWMKNDTFPLSILFLDDKRWRERGGNYIKRQKQIRKIAWENFRRVHVF